MTEEKSYCRLCAEATSNNQLLAAEDVDGINFKILKKMQWINVDVSNDLLPNAICFACFDSLERTWIFLHNVRAAQKKLAKIFSCDNNVHTTNEDVGRPVDCDWEVLTAANVKEESEVPTNNFENERAAEKKLAHILSCDNRVHTPNEDAGRPIDCEWEVLTAANVKEESDEPTNNFEDEMLIEINEIKIEKTSDIETDSDIPLLQTRVKKKKKKKKLKNIVHITSEDITWDDYTSLCANCDAQCMTIAALRSHSLEKHARCFVSKCLICAKISSNYRLLINHARSHNQMLNYHCEYCNKYIPSISELKKHRNTAHQHVYKTYCHNCGEKFDTPESLEDHMIAYSNSYKKCGRRSTKIRPHNLKCDMCSRDFKSLSNLIQHKKVHMERTRDFGCHKCGKMFFTKGALVNHLAIHEEVRPHKCEYCPLAFRARGNLQAHLVLHSGSKPFVCEQCGKSFRMKRHLKSHSIMHTDLMPYACEFCNKLFRFKTRLNLHLRQHTGAKPYNCIQCQRDFTNGSNFKKHMKRRHNIDISKKKKYTIVDKPDEKIESEEGKA
ncbi:zinc finger protein 85 [Bombyx mori]|uniref:Uncharacterized protein n=1 Tax=Bombyx mori TaxID=7091 RepID=A0A8R2AJU1_BOMMO|nr:zinc finger protein 85 [Bombyx mori]